MFLSADVVSLVLYCAQQLGVTLGVGAQTIMLIAYLSAMRDGIVDAKEAQFSRAVRAVLNAGLVLIIISGVGVTVMHVMAGQTATILSSAYLFKWLLVFAVLAFTLLKNLPQHILQGLAGGSWYALFIVHILAPVASWANLALLYAVWMVGFGICWAILVFTTKERKGGAKEVKKESIPVAKPAPALKSVPDFPFAPKPIPPPAPPAPKPVPPPPPAPKPMPPPPPPLPPPKPVAPPPVNLPVLEQPHILQTLPQPEVPKQAQPASPAAPAPEQNPWLPALKIMPKTPGDAQKQNPGATISPK